MIKNHTGHRNQLIIFDFDGVLVDTEYATFQYYQELMPRYGFQLQESDFQFKLGRKSVDFFRSIMGDRYDAALAEKLTQQKRAAFTAAPDKFVTPIPGAFDLVKQCHQAHLILAIGSQNERPMLQATLSKFNLNKYFAVVRSLQDLTHKKPHPEIFLGIAQKFKIPPSLSVVLEDAPDGVTAARRGGFNVVGVTTSTTAANLPGAHLYVTSPAQLTPEQLITLH